MFKLNWHKSTRTLRGQERLSLEIKENILTCREASFWYHMLTSPNGEPATEKGLLYLDLTATEVMQCHYVCYLSLHPVHLKNRKFPFEEHHRKKPKQSFSQLEPSSRIEEVSEKLHQLAVMKLGAGSSSCELTCSQLCLHNKHCLHCLSEASMLGILFLLQPRHC